MKLNAVLSVSWLLCNSVLKMDNCIFREYTDTHLILGKSRGNDAAAVRLYAERYPQRRLPKQLTFHAIDIASGRPVLFALTP
jgi:hypothetical protein